MRNGVWLAAVLLLCGACGAAVKQQGARVRTMAELSETARGSLATKRIFFGHQSVGGNIMDGVADLIRQQPAIVLKIVGLEGAAAEAGGFFAHAKVGRNEHPGTKSDAFAKLLDDGLAARVDVAFHKYCYADIVDTTDAGRVFEHYKQTMARLRANYPRVTFVHVTTPLTAVQAGPKAAVKKLLGRAPDHYQSNFRREHYNALMRREYAGHEPVFDLAALEATDADGRPVTISFQGLTSRTLFGAFTTDGGHLNETGRRRVADNLLVFLAELEK